MYLLITEVNQKNRGRRSGHQDLIYFGGYFPATTRPDVSYTLTLVLRRFEMENTRTRGSVDKLWDASILSTLVDYIRIPNKSPLFDPEWEAHGHMDRALDRIVRWIR